MGRIARSWPMWARHLVQMKEGRPRKKAEEVKQPGPRERQQLRWEDYANRDVRKAGRTTSGGRRLPIERGDNSWGGSATHELASLRRL